MCCGRVLNVSDFQESDRICCAECSGFVWCSCCETWAAADEMSYDDDGNAYCYWCASDKFNTCDCCGETKLCDEHFKIAPNGFTVAVFTPKNIVSQMLGLYKTSLLKKYILEPSCGDGAFLCAIVERYIKEFLAKNKDLNQLKVELETFIYGIEIDNEIISKANDKYCRFPYMHDKIYLFA